MLKFAALAYFAFVAVFATASPTVLSNTDLPTDTRGKAILTGETSILTFQAAHYFYVNDWGGCADVDCCQSPGGCASCCYVPPSAKYPDPCVFAFNHSVHVYRTKDLKTWYHLGVALGPRTRPEGIEFRPHVVFNEATQLFVMWYEDRPQAIRSSGYTIAVSKGPEGPFHTEATKVAVAGVPGDFDILVDDDGTAWHVQTTTNDPSAANGFTVTALNTEYTAPATPRRASSFVAPRPAEGPIFFKRSGSYYILGGTTCCACRGGSSIYVFRADSPLGPWRFVNDVGSNPRPPGTPFDIHNPNSFVTKAQASAVLDVGNNQWLWLGNQWVTSERRNADLLYWTLLAFDENGDVLQVEHADNATVYL